MTLKHAKFFVIGATIGETEAFDLLAEIEALAIREKKSRVAEAYDLLVEALG